MPGDHVIGLRSDGLSWRELDDQVVVLDAKSSRYLTINGAGVVIWRALAEGAALDAIVRALVEEYDVDEHVARNDVVVFLDDLRERGLLADT